MVAAMKVAVEGSSSVNKAADITEYLGLLCKVEEFFLKLSLKKKENEMAEFLETKAEIG